MFGGAEFMHQSFIFAAYRIIYENQVKNFLCKVLESGCIYRILW